MDKIITGKPGSGKATTIKHILLNEYAKGTKIIIIDPEREYKAMCEANTWENVLGRCECNMQKQKLYIKYKLS